MFCAAVCRIRPYFSDEKISIRICLLLKIMRIRIHIFQPQKNVDPQPWYRRLGFSQIIRCQLVLILSSGILELGKAFDGLYHFAFLMNFAFEIIQHEVI